MPRLRKAWRVRVSGYDGSDIWFAATAGRARSSAWSRMGDFAPVRIVDIKVRREKSRDVELPDRHEIVDRLSYQELHCLMHAFGGNNDPINAGYRDYFYTRKDDPNLVKLAEHGLMSPMAGDQFGPNMTYFVMTDLGKAVALSMVPEYPR